MKVLQITAFSGWGCTGRIALGIYNALEEKGYDACIAWGRKNTAPPNVKTIKIGNKFDQQIHGLYTRITDKCGFGSKSVTKKFLKDIDEYSPDIIHLHIMHGYYINLEVLFNYIKKKNIPIVWTFHDCWAFTGHCPYFDLVNCEKWKTGCYKCEQKKKHPTSLIMDNSKYNWEKKKETFTGVKNMTIVTPSKWLANLVTQSFLKDYKIKIINNGIDLENFKPSQSTFRKRYNLEDKKVILGVSSSWVKSKGLEDFCQLSKKLSKDYKIILVGLTKKQKENIPNNIIGIERTDSIKELAEIYSSADVFLNLTYEDNYPTTNLEALACGTPVITYNTGGSVEAVLESKAGAIVKQGDIEDVKNKIIEIVKEDKVNKKRLFQCSDRENNLEYIKLYEQILRS